MFRHLLALNQLQRAILKFPVSGGEPTELVTELNELPDGIVVDPARQNIYWTNMGVPTLTDANQPLTEHNLDFYGKERFHRASSHRWNRAILPAASRKFCYW